MLSCIYRNVFSAIHTGCHEKLRPRKLSHAMFIINSQIILSSPVYPCRAGGYKTDFNLNNIIATPSLYLFGKKFNSKCHQSLGCYFKPC